MRDERLASGQTDLNQHLVRKVEELGLSVRTTNCLRRQKLVYIGQVVQRSEINLMKTKYFGRKTLLEMKQILGSMGLSLGMTEESNPAIAKFNEFLKNNQ